MVFLSKACLAVKTRRGKTFLDKLRVYVRGGGGGQGHRKYGGQGGRGGHVYAVGEERATLKGVVAQNPKKRFVAAVGTNSTQRAIFGEPGSDIEIPVPLGILVKNDAGRILGEVNAPGDRVLVAKGGAGGGPATGYLGQKGHVHSVTFDLRLIADVGLVGYDYPATAWDHGIWRSETVADLPGLIEGAHLNIGMGHSFLKHVERTKLMLFVVDVVGFRLSAKHVLRSALENVLLLNKELELFKPELVQTPAVLAVNKIDLPDGERLAEELKGHLSPGEDLPDSVPKELRPKTRVHFDEIIPISAKRRLNTDYLQQRLRDLLDVHAEEAGSDAGGGAYRAVQAQLREHRGSDLV